MATNYQQAPKLLSRGVKKTKGSNGQSWIFDPDLLCWLGVECGKSASQYRLMIYLMGNKAGSWKCSTEDVLNRTGISDKQSLSKIKKKLKDKGWIDYEEGKHITVLYDNLYEQMGSSEDYPKIEVDLKVSSEDYPQIIEKSSEDYPKTIKQGSSQNDPLYLKSSQDDPMGSSQNVQGQFSELNQGSSQDYHNNISNIINNKINKQGNAGPVGSVAPSSSSSIQKEQKKDEVKVNKNEVAGMTSQFDLDNYIGEDRYEIIDDNYVRIWGIPKPGIYQIINSIGVNRNE